MTSSIGMYVAPLCKVKVVAQSLKITGSALIRRHASLASVDDLADLRQFQLEEDDHPALSSELSDAVSSGVRTTEIRSFQEIPGPRGLPVIGNMLSYSKLGKSASCFYRLSSARHRKIFCVNIFCILLFLFVLLYMPILLQIMQENSIRAGLVIPRSWVRASLALGCRVATMGQLLFAPWAWAYSTLHP